MDLFKPLVKISFAWKQKHNLFVLLSTKTWMINRVQIDKKYKTLKKHLSIIMRPIRNIDSVIDEMRRLSVR